jgi:hypothetical protein
MGVSMPLRCVHNANPDLCPFCKIDDELVANPELERSEQRPHDFGCPLFVNESWTDAQHSNYERNYGGNGECNCKRDEKKKESER